MGFYLIMIASANQFYSQRYSEYLEIWLRSPLCLTASFLVSVSSLMSTFVLLLITIDRYLYLAYPFTDRRLSYKVNVTALSIFWFITIIFVGIPIAYSINQAAPNRLYETNSVCLPGNTKNRYLMIWLLSYCGTTFLIWFAIAIMYVAILYEIIQSRKMAQREISAEDNIIILKMITIVATDLISWMPLYIVIIRVLLGYQLATHTLPFIAVLSLPINSCLNPILYTVFTQKFIDFIRTLLERFSCRRCYSSQQTDSNYTSTVTYHIQKDIHKCKNMPLLNTKSAIYLSKSFIF